MRLIERKSYLDRLSQLKGTPDIKIITGIRRCGKSKLLRAFAERIIVEEGNANIIYIDLSLLENEPLKEYHALYTYIQSCYKSECQNYVMIDEVQLCPDFELAINSLYSIEKYDIYLTGSNAFLLSSDLATLFTGRQIEIPIFPFSYKEYCSYFEIADPDRHLDEFVVSGGMSGSYVYDTPEERSAYIKGVFNTILVRDLTEKYHLSDPNVLTRLSEYLMDNVSNISSPNNISTALTANHWTISHVSIGKYLKYLCQAFMFYKANRYDIRGKKYLESLNKYYLVDTGFRYALLGHRNMDWGRAYENIVYIELLRRGYEVYIGKLYQKEIDFVALRRDEKIYIQVSDNIEDSETFNREAAPLLAIKDAYPKMIVANTKHPESDYNGIRIVDIAQWLIAS